MKVIIFAILGYLIWALVHHRHDKSLTWPVLIEYLLTILLVLILLTGVLP